MDTIGTFEMANTFSTHGLIVAIHKHYSLEDWQQFAKGENVKERALYKDCKSEY